MKNIFILILSIFLIHTAYSQSPTVKGKVIDPESEKVIPFAQIAFYKSDSKMPVTGGSSDVNGSFKVAISPGDYKMIVSFVGYKDNEQNITVTKSGLNVGEIPLSVEEEIMDEVVVTGNEIKRPMVSTMEGMTIKPDQTIANVGGTLLDILRNTPSVSVGDDGGVSLRGSGSTNVLIDGRNSALASDLEQIPASAIEEVEIINNPNAKYDASSDGGIINIILKRGEDLGTTGRAELTMGSRMRTNANINLSRRTTKFAAYGGYSYRKWPRVGSRETERRTTFNGEKELFRQEQSSRNEDFEHTINYGGDYFWGQNKLSIEGVFNTEDENDFQSSSAFIQNLNTEEILTSYVRNTTETEKNYTYDNALIYERDFNDKEKFFRASASVSIRDQVEGQNIDVFNNTLQSEGQNPNRIEGSNTDEFRNTSVIQADYATPIFTGLLEAGYKSIFRKFDNDYIYGLVDPTTDEINPYDSISNRFIYQDQIHALYAIYSDSLPSLTYAVGLRAEQTILENELSNVETSLVAPEDLSNSQDYLNFFPSVQLAYFLNDNNTLKTTYSRRIDRPSGWRLNPFPDFSDSLNVRVGEPNLQPEFINSFEVGHMYQKGGITLTTNAFYRRINGQVDWIVRVEDGISYRGPQNLNSASMYGIEFLNTSQINKWWNLNASYTIFESRIDGTNLDESFVNRGLSWYAKVTTGINLPLDINLQFTGNYYAPEIEAQGRDLARYYVDGSLQRYFFDKHLSLSASFRDLFDSRNFRGQNFGPNFEQTFVRKRETQIMLFTASYNFKAD
ncbi:TonB-dependent receptor domain-containing protein [Marivirga sp.]|uniref:TonB-dependent receptor domain-containing protein n=1 Tax=Marivirga sp. TaxID=2018662 RepID=UPI002D7F4E7A|nr:TonB-dependent receptor [Marivirga sp.]HET8861327.1 TonB-dependent receptor [Marivirga sp.]